MATHTTGTREQWLAARLELLAEEKKLTRSSDEAARRRQQLPWVRIDKPYRFDRQADGATKGLTRFPQLSHSTSSSRSISMCG
jgi:predicted dithiol-disulfide oxidoreductase (DUF899 family)